MTAAANWVTGSGLRYPRAYRPNRAGRQCWANFATEAWKSPEEPPEKLSLYYCTVAGIKGNLVRCRLFKVRSFYLVKGLFLRVRSIWRLFAI